MSQDKPREFKLHFYYGSCQVELASEYAFIKNTEKIHVIEKSAFDRVVEALKKINAEELNSQRPGGGHSVSARLSYQALKDVGVDV